MKTKEKGILFMLHLPPPVHGSSVVGAMVRQSTLVSRCYRVAYLNLILSRKVSESGRGNAMKLLRCGWLFLRLLFRLTSDRPHLCYYALTTTGGGLYKDLLLIALLRLFRVPLLFHIHNKGVAAAGQKRINDLLYRMLFRKGRVILLSPHLYADVASYVPEEQVYYCPNGIPDHPLPAAMMREPAERPFSLLFFSNLIRNKGLFTLVDACYLLKEWGYTFRCVVAGSEGDVSAGQFNAYLRQREMSDRVVYLGPRYGEQKEITFGQADLFVLPTRNDCFPLTLIEAMQHALPVIATPEGGIPDMVEEGITGFLVSGNHLAEQIARHTAALIRDPALCKRMGVNGRRRFERYYTYAHFEKRLCDILEETLLLNG